MLRPCLALLSFYAPPQDGGIELALRAAVQELVQLVQNLAVRVGAVGRLTFVRLAETNHLLKVAILFCAQIFGDELKSRSVSKGLDAKGTFADEDLLAGREKSSRSAAGSLLSFVLRTIQIDTHFGGCVGVNW